MNETIEVLEDIKAEINKYAFSDPRSESGEKILCSTWIVEQIINKHIEDIERK